MSTYTPIASQTVGTATPSIIFSSIPQNYTDLILVFNGGHNSASGFAFSVRFNGVTSNQYSSTVLDGNGSSASSYRYGAGNAMYLGSPGKNNLNSNVILQLNNYSNSSTFKTILSRANNTAVSVFTYVGLWQNTAPITQIEIFPETASWLTGTTFTIYGVSAGNSSAKATGGNIVTTDGTYWYHAFTSSGIFTPSSALSADVLVVAGGGGGGSYAGGGGGGGAGGVIYFANQSLTSSVYTATIGAGGGADTSGTNSIFGSLTAGIGGGKGGTGSTGFSGGSGGGGSDGAGGSSTQTGTGATSYYGYAGGTGTGAGTTGGGGGGGAGAVGGDVSGSFNKVAGNGGIGTNAFSSWASATSTGVSSRYAAGGGGASYTGGGGTAGTGGTGGGGDGTYATRNAVANTGSGGGGGGYTSSAQTPGNGASGIIIIRYAV